MFPDKLLTFFIWISLILYLVFCLWSNLFWTFYNTSPIFFYLIIRRNIILPKTVSSTTLQEITILLKLPSRSLIRIEVVGGDKMSISCSSSFK